MYLHNDMAIMFEQINLLHNPIMLLYDIDDDINDYNEVLLFQHYSLERKKEFIQK